MTRTYELGDQSFTAEAVSQLAEYHRRVDLERFGKQEMARFAVLSTPRVELGFQTFNPLDGITEEALLKGSSRSTRTSGSASGSIRESSRCWNGTSRWRNDVEWHGTGEGRSRSISTSNGYSGTGIT